jgi:excisionase family DNA binding protein
MTDPSYLTTDQVAEILQVRRQTVVARCRRGEIRHIKVAGGRQYRISTEALSEYVDRDPVLEDARYMLGKAISEGRLPAEPTPELLGRIAEVLRER